jgi:endo-1,4-beta-xylanase
MMTRTFWLALGILVVPFQLTAQSVRPIASGSDKFLGCAWSNPQSTNFANYWNQLTPENASKWGSVEATRDVMNWTALDAAYNVAKKNHIPFKLHTLIWGAQQPSWIGALDSASQRNEIEEWFAALAARYDSVALIDVVNEPMNNAPNGMTPWGATTPNVNYAKALGGAGQTGWDWVITAFRLARKYFPDSKLIMNEYSVINNSNATHNYIDIINLLKADTLIDGIGEQAHAFTTYGTTAATMQANLDLLAATGLPIYLTEMDIDGTSDVVQLKEYERVFPIFWNHPAVAGITLWGFRTGLWRNDQGAYLINQNGTERPAMKWLKAFVNDTLTLTQSIVVSPADNVDSIFVGDKIKMNAAVLPANTTIPQVSWSVIQTSLGSIDNAGNFTAIAPGKATIKAVAWDGSNVSGAHIIVISKRLADSVVVTSQGNVHRIFEGDQLQMSAVIWPANTTNKAFSWSVSPDSVAAIDQNGLLTAGVAGQALVTAAALDGSGRKDTLHITVSKRLPSGVSETGFEFLRIYPNPVTNGSFTISGLSETKKIQVFNLSGNMLAEFDRLNQSSIKLSLSLDPGIYLLKLSNEKNTILKKLVVE